MADEAVRQVQRWLNSHYNFGIDEDGYTGGVTVNALIKALQTELGLAADGSFGNGTKTAFNTMFPNGLNSETNPTEQSKKNIIYILRGGMYCRGIDGGSIGETEQDTYKFTSSLELAITQMKSQLGIQNPTTTTTATEMKAVLTTDAYILVSSGDQKVREIQQALNRKYLNIFGDYLATNGLYERNTNKAIKMAIQLEIGVTPDGSWGNATKNALPALSYGSSRTNLVYLLQYLLYLNGFDPNGFDGSFGNGARTGVRNFQTLMHLEVDGSVGPQTWFALVLSSGDTSRSANACDTRFEITAARAQVLKNAGYQVVGRYLTGGDFKELREGELSTIFDAGLKAFIIYQANNRLIDDFSYSKGKQAAVEASASALKNRIPENTVIYFAVDLDVYEDQINSYIIQFFRGVNDYINSKYKVGIYGPRLVCQRVAEANLSTSSFVADMSTGYSCNIGQKMPSNWCYDQFTEISKFNNDFDIDKVTYNNNIPALSSLDSNIDFENRNKRLRDFLREAYDLASGFNGNNATVKENNSLVLQYISQLEYPSSLWTFLVEYNQEGIDYIKNNISRDDRDIGVYVNEINKIISLPHLTVSSYCVVNDRTGIGTIDAAIADLTGWAGDLLQFAGEFEEKLKQHVYPSYSEDLIIQLIGNEESLGFGLEDLIQDIDVWNLYQGLKEFRIDLVFNSYYVESASHRFEGFVNNRISYGYLTDDVEDSNTSYYKIYSLAKHYLSQDYSNLSGILANLFKALKTKPITLDIVIENTAKAFAKKVTSMI